MIQISLKPRKIGIKIVSVVSSLTSLQITKHENLRLAI